MFGGWSSIEQTFRMNTRRISLLSKPLKFPHSPVPCSSSSRKSQTSISDHIKFLVPMNEAKIRSVEWTAFSKWHKQISWDASKEAALQEHLYRRVRYHHLNQIYRLVDISLHRLVRLHRCVHDWSWRIWETCSRNIHWRTLRKLLPRRNNLCLSQVISSRSNNDGNYSCCIHIACSKLKTLVVIRMARYLIDAMGINQHVECLSSSALSKRQTKRASIRRYVVRQTDTPEESLPQLRNSLRQPVLQPYLHPRTF